MPEPRQNSKRSLRRIRVLNGASAIIKLVKNQPFRCVFVGEMPMYLNGGGRVPLDLDLVLIPQPIGTQVIPNITDLLCQHKSTKFKFVLDRNQIKYVDLSGGIPVGKQDWCKVKIKLIQGPLPPRFDLDNVVEIYEIPTIHVFFLYIDVLQLLVDTYNFPGSQPWLTKHQIKKFRTFMEPLSREAIPQSLDQACAALTLSKQVLAILSGLYSPSSQLQHLANCLRKISTQIENWVYTHQCSINVSSPVTQEVDKGPEPSSADEEEDRDESEDWVEITISTGVIKNYLEEQADEALDFELLNID